MKKGLLLSFALATMNLTVFAQAQKYVLLEHFTNTYCSTCASQNPGFYQTIGVETNKDVHHISIHSSVPYQQCPYYQANKIEQDGRKDYYGLTSTPRVSVNGAALVGAGSVTSATITAATAGTSPIELKIAETTGTSRTVTVTFKNVGTYPSGDYRLYAAVVEKKITFAANNGESTHHNVFRKYLSNGADIPFNGIPINFTSNTQTVQLFYDVAPSWNAAQTYVLVWVQNESSNVVLNSATRFDAQTSTEEPSIDAFVQVSPNPTSGKTTISFAEVTPQYLTIQNAVGQVLETRKLINNAPVELDLSSFASGVLFVKVQSLEGSAIKRIVKQ